MMSPSTDALARYLADHEGELIPLQRLLLQFQITETTQDRFMNHLRRAGAHSLDGDLVLFETDIEKLAFQMMLQVAPNISVDEFRQYRDSPHILMRLSRDRNVIAHENKQARGLPPFLV